MSFTMSIYYVPIQSETSLMRSQTVISKSFVFSIPVNCVIVRGKPYDVDVLQAERTRFERFIRDHGFYGIFKRLYFFQS